MSKRRHTVNPQDKLGTINKDALNSTPTEPENKLLTPDDFAQYIEFSNGYPHTLIEVGVARGGTTAMSQVLACSSSFDAYGEDMLRNAVAYRLREGAEPDMIRMPGEDSHIILKETYGPATESMVSHYPLKVLQLAAEHAGVTKDTFLKKTQLLAVTRDPLAIYNAWLKYWTIAKSVPTIEDAHELFGNISLTNLVEAYNCLTETVLTARSEGIKTTVIVTEMFKNPSQGIQGAIKAICQRLGVEFNNEMIIFQDRKKDQKRDIYPVTVDAKYIGLHEDIGANGFRYFAPSYRFTDEILPILRDASLLSQYQLLHHMAEDTFDTINLPYYLKDDFEN